MIIKTIKTQVKQIALKTPFITALRRVDYVEFVRVSIFLEDKTVAFGEAPATKAITGEGIDEILYSIEKIQHNFYNKTAQESLDILHQYEDIGSSAKAALDMAFVSLLAKEKGIPLFKYFGAKKHKILLTDITISLQEHNKMVSDAKNAVENGMTILKIKFGKDIKHAVAVTKSIIQELPEATLLIDANQAWSLKNSLIYINEFKNSKIELIEQPVIANDLVSLKDITMQSKIPILADESTFDFKDVKYVIESQSADMINIKFMKCGGVTKAIEILEYARQKNIKCMLGSMLEGPNSINIALHLALAYQDIIKYIDLDSPLLYKKSSHELEFNFDGSKITYKYNQE